MRGWSEENKCEEVRGWSEENKCEGVRGQGVRDEERMRGEEDEQSRCRHLTNLCSLPTFGSTF